MALTPFIAPDQHSSSRALQWVALPTTSRIERTSIRAFTIVTSTFFG
jgi:hypothetical protein